MNIDNPANIDKVAVVCVGYNRIRSLSRLMESLLKAKYPSADIPLVISIDCSNNEELYSYVRNFKWPFGNKYVFIQEKRLGLKEHIYKCGDLTRYFKAIILLEDDLYVSPFYYSYVLQSLERYSEDPRIAEISLYKNESNGYVGLPFSNIQNGADVFLMQDVSTWGECWTADMWNAFKEWRDTHDEAYINNIDMPDEIKHWTKAWSKYYNAYVTDTNKYVLYPNVSLTTNFCDAGVHGNGNNSIVQVNLLQEDFKYRMPSYENLAKYDIYFNNADIPEWLAIDPETICLDTYGFNRNIKPTHKYLLSSCILPYKIIKSYAANMRPIELNIKNEICGNGLHLYEICRENGSNKKIIRHNPEFIDHFLCLFSPRIILRFCKLIIKRHFIRKIGRK